MQKLVANGRGTPGSPQKNDALVQLGEGNK